MIFYEYAEETHDSRSREEFSMETVDRHMKVEINIATHFNIKKGQQLQ